MTKIERENLRIQFITSDPHGTEHLRSELSALGHRITTATTQDEPISSADFDGVLLDAADYSETRLLIELDLLRALAPSTPIVVLASRVSDAAIERGTQRGAIAWMRAPASAAELEAQLRGLAAAGNAAAEREAPSDAPLTISRATGTVRVGDNEVALTSTEFAIFAYLARPPGRWATAKEIIQTVIGTTHQPDTSLVRVHVHKLRQKLRPLGLVVENRRSRGYSISFSSLR